MNRYLAAFAALTMAFTVGACDDDDDVTDPGGNPDPAATGAIAVTANTLGSDLDGTGYTAEVTAETTGDEPSTDPNPEARDLGINGSVTFDERVTGDHLVQLTDVASNCTVGGLNPRQVKVEADATTTVTFEVTCSAPSGSIRVEATTSGEDTDPDGYTVELDGESATIDPEGFTTFEGLTDGEYTVELTGLAANCSAEGENPRTVEVAEEGAASTLFVVNCTSTST